jgi:uncharacterized protein (TIGR02453 family)
MKQTDYLADEMLPPFAGFPVEGIQFLRRLKRNNDRKWFSEHKTEYEELVKFPMLTFIASLAPLMEKMAPEIDINPKKNIFRIHRDTKFSRDKTPYKTNVAAVFHLHGHWQESAGFYVHIEPGNIYAGGGLYMPNGQQLKKIRRAIADRSREFLSIVCDDEFVSLFSELEGEKLNRVPQGFPKDHLMGEWLKYKSYYAGVEWNEKECLKPAFLDKVVGLYREILPLVRFLNSALHGG